MDRAVLGEFSTILCKELVARGFPAKHAFDAQRSAMTLATGWTMIPADPNYPDDTPEPSFKRGNETVALLDLRDHVFIRHCHHPAQLLERPKADP